MKTISKSLCFLAGKPPDSVTDEEEIIQNTLEWLMDHINEDIEAPKDVVEYFGEIQQED